MNIKIFNAYILKNSNELLKLKETLDKMKEIVDNLSNKRYMELCI